MRKIIFPFDIPNFSSELQAADQRIILVGGCFDIFHYGHEAFLKAAHRQDGRLVVMLESDESVRRRKGERRPHYTQIQRAEMLASLSYVYSVLLLPYMSSDHEYFELVKVIRPDIIGITQGDPYTKVISGYASAVGGRCVEVIKRIPGHSSSELIAKYNL